MDQSWKLSGKKYGPFMEIVWELYGQVKSMFTNFLTLLYSENNGINKFLDHFQIFPTYGETMEEKTKDSQCCTISKYWPYMEKMWKTVSVGQFFRCWPYMEKICQRKLQTSSTRPFSHTWKKYNYRINCAMQFVTSV